MSRFIVTLQPAHGHLQPLIPYLRALHEHEHHEVVVATSASFVPAVEKAGLPATACGMDWLESEAEETFPELTEMPLKAVAMYWGREVFLGPPAGAMARDVAELGREWGADAVLCETYEFGGHLAAEMLDIPHAVCSVGGRVPPVVLQLVFADKLAEWRRELGLAEDPDQAALYRWACLSPITPSWLPAGDEPLATEHFFAPLTSVTDGPVEPPRWLQDFSDGRPLVYATLGTVFNRTPGVFEAILAGLADEPWAVVATVGKNRDPAEFGPYGDHVRVESFVPHNELLPFCDAIVSHSGFGTTLDGVYAGLPHVAVPLTADQPVHATAVERFGVGRIVADEVVDPNPIGLPEVDPARLTPDVVRDATRAVLESAGEHREAAKAVREEIAGLPGPSRFVELAGELARDRRPLLRAGVGEGRG